jgi:hypothetical protein
VAASADALRVVVEVRNSTEVRGRPAKTARRVPATPESVNAFAGIFERSDAVRAR